MKQLKIVIIFPLVFLWLWHEAGGSPGSEPPGTGSNKNSQFQNSIQGG